MSGGGHEDDPTILDAEHLWRRIHPGWYIPDKNQNRMRLSSAAFRGARMSVYLGDRVLKSGRTKESLLDNLFPGYGLASIAVSLVRQCKQKVCADPIPEEPQHALVIGDKPRKISKQFAREALMLIEPAGTTS